MARSKNKEVVRVVKEMKKADIRIIDSRLKFILFLFIFYLEKLGLGFKHDIICYCYMTRLSIIYQSHDIIEGSRRL